MTLEQIEGLGGKRSIYAKTFDRPVFHRADWDALILARKRYEEAIRKLPRIFRNEK